MSHESANLDLGSSYIGRFAPSPTGDLHFGSLLAALASYLEARKSAGCWLLRIEDLDKPREVAGSADLIISELAQWGMHSDGAVLYQKQRNAAYQAACTVLIEQDLAYWCGCSRSELSESGIYPGTCSKGLPPGKKPRALRLRTADCEIEFDDGIQGPISQQLQQDCGDFVIRRADGLYAYQLAVVVDDAFQQVTDIVRGADLLDSTPRQIWLQRCLGLPQPRYSHIPVVVQADGRKLSKRIQSDPLRASDRLRSLRLALQFLGHEAPGMDWQATWDWAFENWNSALIPRCRSLTLDAACQSSGKQPAQ
ncbi:MAG TPA: tRNA glutamyl-Q(34) synthetase GluQRS [Xanthomonadales bacterium]|nr:tRNA glutamyl-Q(34) synthetase GluQRS [Xanthomonadales bacterium]